MALKDELREIAARIHNMSKNDLTLSGEAEECGHCSAKLRLSLDEYNAMKESMAMARKLRAWADKIEAGKWQGRHPDGSVDKAALGKHKGRSSPSPTNDPING